jgi:hypothetical protein
LRDDSIRVFVSSTFKDMKEERNILVSRVFQRLRQLARERYSELAWVDLRWGITKEHWTCCEVVRLLEFFQKSLTEHAGADPSHYVITFRT